MKRGGSRGGSPFEALRGLRDKLPPGRTEGPRTPVATEAPAEPARPVDERELFAREMAGVAPIDRGPRRISPPRRAHSSAPPTQDDLVRAHLRDLVAGDAPFDVADTVEYIEGSIVGLDRRIVKRLRRGEFAIQAHLDLHGFDRDTAHDAVVSFIREARRRTVRCVLVVHGRGRGSKDQIPVLKEKMTTWLTRGWLSRQVLAFSSARPHDGGAGAVYVLLRD